MNKSQGSDKFSKIEQVAMVITSNLICLDLPRGKIKEITSQIMDDLSDILTGLDKDDKKNNV